MQSDRRVAGRSSISREIRRIVQSYEPLPPPILRALCMLADEELGLGSIAGLVEDLEGLREQILTVANSSYYAPRTPVRSVDHAATMIGQRGTSSILMAHSLQPYFGHFGGYGYAAFGLWQHSIAVGATGWALADNYGLSGATRSTVYVAGLFHDVGKLAIAEYLTRENARLDLGQTPDDPPGLAGLERRELGICHAEVGALLAKHWGLDPNLQDLLMHHHDPGGEAGEELAVLHLADYLVSNLAVGHRDDLPPETPLAPSALDWLAASPDFLATCEGIAMRESGHAMMIVDVIARESAAAGRAKGRG